MGILDRFLKKNDDGSYTDFLLDYTSSKVGMTKLAIEIGANKIADVISKLGFRIITDDEDDRKDADYMFNVKPNVNQNATDFWKQVVIRMVKSDDGCVVVNMGQRGLYIADSFTVDTNVLKERKYTNVSITVDGNSLLLNKTFRASDVMHFHYHNSRLMRLLKENDELIDDTWEVVLNGVKAKLPVVKVSMPANLRLQNENGDTVTSNEYAQKIAEKFGSAKMESVAVNSQVDIETISNTSSLSSTDLKNLKEEVYDNVAMAMGIPLNVFYGEVTSNADANSAFITYACEPIIEEMNDVINGAYLTKEDYQSGERIVVNTLNVGHIDVINSANNLDKLYQNGWSHNDILDLLGQPHIDEGWADERRFTKNYSSNVEGGETE